MKKLIIAMLYVSTIFACSASIADVWVAGDSKLAKISSNGKILVQLNSVFDLGFAYGIGAQGIIDVDQKNGHVWVSDVNNNRIFQLNEDGKPLNQTTLLSPIGIGIDAKTGAAWTSILLNEITYPRAVVKLDPHTGKELFKVTGFSSMVSAIAVGHSGKVWVADSGNDEVVALFGSDEELNGYDASGPSGAHHLRVGGFNQPLNIDIDSRKLNYRNVETVWVADRNNAQVVKIASDGTVVFRKNPTGFFEVRYVSVSPQDGSVWMGDNNSGRVARLSALGRELQNLPYIHPTSLAVDVTDNAPWVGTFDLTNGARAVKLSSNGSEILQLSGFGIIWGIGSIGPLNKEHCKYNAWANFSFKNQGQCNQFVVMHNQDN